MTAYGRSRQSIAEIEQELDDIFHKHPQSHLNAEGQPAIPGECLVDVFRAFSELYNGVELMDGNEMTMLKALLASNPGVEVTPQTLLQFIAARTKHSPHQSPKSSPNDSDRSLPDERGRTEQRNADINSRSSSNESAGASYYRSTGSRRSSRGPPQTPTGPSPFDASKRQRSIPLGSNAPSSWTRPPAPSHRRRSDAGIHGRSSSDSESFSTSPSAFNGRTSGRARAPSNPTSPTKHNSTEASLFSPPRHSSRPHSRASSQPQNQPVYHYSSPGSPSDLDPPTSPHGSDYDSSHNDLFMKSISSLPMPRQHSDSDPESDGEDSTLGLVLDRSAASSTVSMEPLDRVDALQRANAELGRKLMEAERTLQSKLNDHENELEEMQGRLEEARSELSATKREEKELRAKERQNSTQISALESEIAKLQKSLDNARASYQSLQKQYQEQCAESERYRDVLRARDNAIKDYKDAAMLQKVENQKWAREHDTYEERLLHLEHDLSIAQAAQAQLDEQKQENLMLKETIDRMRYDMDEMRNNAVAGHDKGGSGQSSAPNSMSKSLGAEMMGKMNVNWEMLDHDREEAAKGDVADGQEEDEETEGEEDVVQTIITRKTRKVAGRANKIETHRFEEVKEYSDAYTQHEFTEFTSSVTTQTDPQPKVQTGSKSSQTIEPTTPKTYNDVGTQGEEISSRSRSASPENVETMASSSSTILPPTPRPEIHSDLPPAYDPVVELNELNRRAIEDWHKGTNGSMHPITAGVSNDALEEWTSLKKEMGVECAVIETIISKSEKTGLPRNGRRLHSANASRFYNIYNTYVYNKDGSASFTPMAQVLMCLCASAAMFIYLTPYMVPHYAVPGGPTYYDRTAWASFNSMQAGGEGFSPDGASAVWSFLGTVGGGAARIVRGWPT